ncbi:glycosyltransferase family 4 protein [bacterium]|nr:glycosyltransferase family 4 protein [bacterium]
MSRIALLGVGPLPIEHPDRTHGTSLRAWQFARPLAEAGHEVHLLTMRAHNRLRRDTEIRRGRHGRIMYMSVDEVEHFHNDDFVRAWLSEAAPEAVVGVNLFPAMRACQCAGDLPLWADLNGFALGEAQMKAAQTGDDFYLQHFWRMERVVLLRADHFSTCSTPQLHALVGELSLAGRLSHRTAGCRLIDAVPNARAPEPPAGSAFHLRGAVVPEHAFILLWSGGYNTWLDGDTMLEAVLLAMDAADSLHYVSTGGTLDGYDELTYPAFKRAAEASRHAARFHFLDWIAGSDLPGCYRDADAGISVDRDCYEALLGARNRMTDMLQYGVPIVCTEGPEIARGAGAAGAARLFPFGDARAGAAAILSLVHDPGVRRAMGEAGRALFARAYTDTIAMQPLVEWCKQPQRAPDAGNAPPPLEWAEHEEGGRSPRFLRHLVQKIGMLHPER